MLKLYPSELHAIGTNLSTKITHLLKPLFVNFWDGLSPGI